MMMLIINMRKIALVLFLIFLFLIFFLVGTISVPVLLFALCLPSGYGCRLVVILVP
jgi:hypothetical protein